ncbi:hypothetical protein L798_06723 [Zootermopsis nevadensis]|uniref:Uncharacterized protein n=1 Tax=Zootermopsis nevadensis TaxID=136037 RepID=A0A067RTW5_ZOONE|nr:hypothetical protein L798_06723 [Zootermopsis nevadensis]
MAEEGNCESSPAGPSSTPAVVTTTPEPKLEMSSYMKQLMAEKQKLEEETGPDLQLAHRLLTTANCFTYPDTTFIFLRCQACFSK